MAQYYDSPAMTVLGIETATGVCSVGLVHNDQVLGEISIARQKAHAELLPGMIARLIADVGLALSDLTAVAVSIGPGSFTGLRVGLSAAKGLAQARHIPVLPVETLAALADPVLRRGGAAIAGLSMRNGMTYAASYRWSRTGPIRVGDFFFGMPGTMNPKVRTGTVCVGPVGPDVWKKFIRRTQPKATEAPARLHRPSGAAVALVAARTGQSEDVAGWERLEPLYLQDYPTRRP